MPWFERSTIIKAIKYVDYVIEFKDDDDSARLLLKLVKQTFPNDEIIFANGGDRNATNNREIDVEGVSFVYGVGGSNKMNSSSDILKEWSNE